MVQRLPLKCSFGLGLLLLTILFSCREEGVVHDETKTLEQPGWIQKQPIRWDFSIADTGSTYAIQVVVRQNNQYPFYNLYFSPTLFDATGKAIQKGLAEAILYDPKTGKPKGAGFGDIYEKKFLVYPKMKFKKAGKYSIQLEQSMRVDTLAGMVSIGLLIQK